MEEFLKRTWEHLIERLAGPLHFRFVFQPLASAILGIRAAMKDVRAGQPLFAWSAFTDEACRRKLLKDWWSESARVFIAAIIIDVIYQLFVLHWIYPGQTLLVAAVLALLPYPLFRGVASLIIGLLSSRRTKNDVAPVKRKAS